MAQATSKHEFVSVSPSPPCTLAALNSTPSGLSKFLTDISSGMSAASTVASAAPTAAPSAAPAGKKEEKAPVKEESDEEMGFGLFD